MNTFNQKAKRIRHTRFSQNRTWITLVAVGCWALSVSAQTPEENLIHATFKIFNVTNAGTGFLLLDPAPGASPTNVILVTAAHVFTRAAGEYIQLICRTEDETDGWKRYDHKIAIRDINTNALWTAHHTQDVAVLRCTLPPHVKFSALPLSAIATEAGAKEAGLTAGTRLFYAGFPHRLESNSAAFPLLRDAMVTAFPLFPVSRYPTPFMTAPTFAGDSGAPVAMRQPDTATPLVVGLVVTRTRKTEKLSTDEFSIQFKRDLNLGSFVQAEFIHETLNILLRGLKVGDKDTRPLTDDNEKEEQ